MAEAFVIIFKCDLPQILKAMADIRIQIVFNLKPECHVVLHKNSNHCRKYNFRKSSGYQKENVLFTTGVVITILVIY
jgi:hypothetical protein